MRAIGSTRRSEHRSVPRASMRQGRRAGPRRRRRQDDGVAIRVKSTPAQKLRRLLDDDVNALDLRRHHVPRPIAVNGDFRVLWVEVDLKEVARPPLGEPARDVKIDSPVNEKKPASPGGVPITGPAKQAANEP